MRRVALASWLASSLASSALLALGCSSGAPAPGGEATAAPGEDAPDAAPAPEDEPEGVAGAPVDVHRVPAPYGAEVTSLRLRRSISVRAEPHADAKRYGTVARDIRVGWQSAATGPGCDGLWIEIEPRGWVCDSYLEPSDRAPYGVELPRLGPGEVMPGTYAKVVAAGSRAWVPDPKTGALVPGRALEGSVMVRRWGELAGPGGTYWRIREAEKEYVRTNVLRPFQPSTWSGTRLGDDTGLALPVAFVAAHKNIAEHRVTTFSAPTGGKPTDKLQPRAVVSVLETAAGSDGKPVAYRVGDDRWVPAIDLRVAHPAHPPPAILPGERWIDIDLDQQVLVAYEGELPVYATMISSGAGKNATETGVYRIWIKFAETDMSSGMGDAEAYSVAQVPWTQFYAKDLALHTAYWHDRFGKPRSHGCINLAPRDARFLYFWTMPDVPIGWSMAHGIFEYPGSLVRVRSSKDPDPELRGYARAVYEARRRTEMADATP